MLSNWIYGDDFTIHHNASDHQVVHFKYMQLLILYFNKAEEQRSEDIFLEEREAKWRCGGGERKDEGGMVGSGGSFQQVGSTGLSPESLVVNI